MALKIFTYFLFFYEDAREGDIFPEAVDLGGDWGFTQTRSRS